MYAFMWSRLPKNQVRCMEHPCYHTAKRLRPKDRELEARRNYQERLPRKQVMKETNRKEAWIWAGKLFSGLITFSALAPQKASTQLFPSHGPGGCSAVLPAFFWISFPDALLCLLTSHKAALTCSTVYHQPRGKEHRIEIFTNPAARALATLGETVIHFFLHGWFYHSVWSL